MRAGRLPSIILLAGLLAAGCGGAPRATGWTAHVDTLADTIVVHTTSGSVWGAPAELAEDLSIGVMDGDEAYMLGNVQGLAVSPGGEIYAYDSTVPVLRAYGPTGEHLRDLGREGGGPGEYRNSDGGLAVLPDGRVLLRDGGNARIDVYAPSGEPLGQWPLPSGGGFMTGRKLYTDTAGYTYASVVVDRRIGADELHEGLGRISPQGEHHDTVRAPSWDYHEPIVTASTKNISMTNNVPFSPTAVWTFSPLGYMVGGLPTSYRIDLFRTGRPVLRIERDWTPVPVTAGEKADAEERTTANMRNMLPDWTWNGPAIPDAKPAFSNLFVGDDGRIWALIPRPGIDVADQAAINEAKARHRRLPPRFREPVAFDVFQPDGTYLGQVTTPTGFNTHPQPVFRGDTVWAVVRDSLDVPRIGRFHVTTGG